MFCISRAPCAYAACVTAECGRGKGMGFSRCEQNLRSSAPEAFEKACLGLGRLTSYPVGPGAPGGPMLPRIPCIPTSPVIPLTPLSPCFREKQPTQPRVSNGCGFTPVKIPIGGKHREILAQRCAVQTRLCKASAPQSRGGTARQFRAQESSPSRHSRTLPLNTTISL